MKDSEILTMLKVDLEKLTVPTGTQTYLETLISVAKDEIQREGIVLEVTETSTAETPDYTLDDSQTIEMYAAYLYRRRAESDNGMPRMLRYRLNNRLFQQKAQATLS